MCFKTVLTTLRLHNWDSQSLTHWLQHELWVGKRDFNVQQNMKFGFAQHGLQTFSREADCYVKAVINFHVANCKKTKNKTQCCLTFISFAQHLTTHCDVEPIAATPSSHCALELSSFWCWSEMLKVQCINLKGSPPVASLFLSHSQAHFLLKKQKQNLFNMVNGLHLYVSLFQHHLGAANAFLFTHLYTNGWLLPC